MSLNQCNFIGRVGRDPETRYTADGKAIANFSIAVDGWGKEKTTEWVRITAFGKTAEVVGQYCQKGKQLFVSGRMQTRRWTDKEGQERFTTEIIADQVQLLGSKSEDGEQKLTKATADFDDAPF